MGGAPITHLLTAYVKNMQRMKAFKVVYSISFEIFIHFTIWPNVWISTELKYIY